MIELSVFAVDPGPVESAFVVWDGKGILGSGFMPNQALLQEGKARAMPRAIEMVSNYGMEVGDSIFRTVFWIGRFYEAWGTTHLVTRHDVKLHLCHSARAKDTNIRQALIDRLGEPGKKKTPGVTYGISGHKWAALAVAVTWWDREERG